MKDFDNSINVDLKLMKEEINENPEDYGFDKVSVLDKLKIEEFSVQKFNKIVSELENPKGLKENVKQIFSNSSDSWNL